METIINILMYSLGGIITSVIFFLIIYYTIWLIVNIIKQIKNTE